MASKTFQFGDLVWAKMKGYPMWPGSISRHPEGVLKKAHNYIFFYSSQNYAWIADKEILPHSKELVDKFDAKLKFSKRFVGLQQAVDQICQESRELTSGTTESETENLSMDSEQVENKNEPAPKKPKYAKSSKAKLTYSPLVGASKQETEKPKKDDYEFSDGEDSASAMDDDSSQPRPLTENTSKNISSVKGRTKARDSQGKLQKPKKSVKAEAASIPLQDSSDEMKDLAEQQATSAAEGDLKSDAQDHPLGFKNIPSQPRSSYRKNSSLKRTHQQRSSAPKKLRLGLLGAEGISLALLRCLHLKRLNVWSEEKTATRYEISEAFEGEINFVPDPKDLLNCSDVVLCFVADSQHVRELLLDGSFWSEAKAQPAHSKGFVLCGNHMTTAVIAIADLLMTPGIRFLNVCIPAKFDASNVNGASLVASGDPDLQTIISKIFDRMSVELDFYGVRPEFSATLNIGASIQECISVGNLTQLIKIAEFLGINSLDLMASLEDGSFCGESIFKRLEAMVHNKKSSAIAAPFTPADIITGVNLFLEFKVGCPAASITCDMYRGSKGSSDEMDISMLLNSFEKQRIDSA